MAGCGADTQANVLIGTLTSDAVFPIPNPDLSDLIFPPGALDRPITPLTVADITTGSVDGPGAFDVLMRGYKAHLEKEFDDGRITGDDYTKAYIALTESAMSQSVAFLLQKDQSFWQAQLIQVQAFTARVELEVAKVRLAESQYSASTQKANYALTKMQIANADNEYCISKYTLDNLLPKQLEKLQLDNAGQTTANSAATYTLAEMLPQQLKVLKVQEVQIREGAEAQRAQTTDLRTDGFPVGGVLGKQKDLYAQQVTSYQRDSEVKAAKLFTDAFTVQKTMDEGLIPPNGFTNVSIDQVLTVLKTNNGFS